MTDSESMKKKYFCILNFTNQSTIYKWSKNGLKIISQILPNFCKSPEIRRFTLQTNFHVTDAFLSHFFGNALCLKQPSSICSFHFRERYVGIGLNFIYYLLLILSLLNVLKSMYNLPKLSFSLKVTVLMQIYGRFRLLFTFNSDLNDNPISTPSYFLFLMEISTEAKIFLKI